MKDWKAIIEQDERYNNGCLDEVTWVGEEPVPFSELFEDQNSSEVDIRDINFVDLKGKKSIIGFVGKFKWEDNEITSLDGDSYDADRILVAGYEWFDYEDDDGEDHIDGLTIFVTKW